MFTQLRSISIAAAILPALFGTALAGSTTLTLSRTSLTNVTDSAGLNQYETGNIVNVDGTTTGYYQITRRVTSAGGVASALNAAGETISLVFATSGPAPYNSMTIEGVHDYTSGEFAGSTSAASAKYKFAIAGDATATISAGTTSLTLGFKGIHSIP